MPRRSRRSWMRPKTWGGWVDEWVGWMAAQPTGRQKVGPNGLHIRRFPPAWGTGGPAPAAARCRAGGRRQARAAERRAWKRPWSLLMAVRAPPVVVV
jgi:hypothetical protein